MVTESKTEPVTQTPAKEHPLPLNAEMVRAVLNGTKNQTRQIVKPQPIPHPESGTGAYLRSCGRNRWDTNHRREDILEDGMLISSREYFMPVHEWLTESSPWQPGDLLWAQESCYFDHAPWSELGSLKDVPEHHQYANNLYYRADGECCQQIPECACHEVGKPKWRPPRQMPRWASRISLRVKSVRVERVRDISEEDAKAEGVAPEGVPTGRVIGEGHVEEGPSWVLGFEMLWDSINGKRDGCSWADNPWVWVIDFEPVTPAAFPPDAGGRGA